MGGDGKIGGGGSCWVNFLVKDGKSPVRRLHAFDMDAKDGHVITVKFPHGYTQGQDKNEFKVEIRDGACIEITWIPVP